MLKLFNDGWEFSLAVLGGTPENWARVDIPHDWLIHDAKNLYKTSDGWYRKSFKLAGISGRRFSLRFEGVYMDSEIYLNGAKIFEWKYGYTTFDVPLESVKEGENEIRVRVRYQSPNSRWYSGAGIFRNIWLRETGPDRIADDGTYVVSSLEGSSWITEIDTEVECRGTGIIRHTLIDADGETVAITRMPFPEGTEKVSASIEIDDPYLWSVKTPYLYSLLTELIVGEEAVDSRFERIGYRYLRFDPSNGLYLNGESIKLNGACMHHDLGALGAAVNRAATRRQLIKLKEMGVNAIRTSHNPPSVEMMELCDELGIMVDSEGFDMWEGKKTDYDYARFFKEWHAKDVRSWVRRDRNHPSLIMWSIGNEIYDTHASPRGVEITEELVKCVRQSDYKNAHPVTIGSNYMRWEGAQNCAEKIDLVGYNYAEDLYDEHHKKHPGWLIYGSETASTIQSRGIYHFPARVFSTTYDDLQCSSLMNCATGWSAPTAAYNITMDRNRRFSLGQFIWTGFDYIGEPTPYQTKNSYFGHIDTAGFPKDTFYAYRAEWNAEAEPFAHLVPGCWDFNEGQLIDVFIYSNCAEAELIVNGKSQGKYAFDHKNGDEITGRWQVEYHPGEIRAIGYNSRGEKVCEDVRITVSDPEEIAVSADKPALFANGTDMIFAEISVLDKDGNAVENARNRIHVEVSGAGRLVGLDNGDSTDYEQYKTDSRRLFSGKLLAMIASKTEPGEIVMKVSSPGLKGKEVRFRALSARREEGISAEYEVPRSEPKTEVSVRKIELHVSDKLITPENKVAAVSVELFPKNNTYGMESVSFKAVTESGVETNLIEVADENGRTVIKPRGDGVYRLRACCRNSSGCDEIISEIEMENRGFGPASFDPYAETVCASLCSNQEELQTGMGGGVITRPGSKVRFDHIDFGKIGSDEITIGIYTYNENVIPIKMTDLSGAEIATLEFQAKTEWNTYKFNTFKLPEKLKGDRGMIFEFGEELRFKGFRFSYPRRLGEEIFALENDGIYGDSFSVGEKMIEKIGNNVTLTFNDIDLSEGASAVEIKGKTRNEKDTVHLRFDGEEDRIIEFGRSENVEAQRFEISGISGIKTLKTVFLPGCDFDFESIKFIR